MLTPGLEGPLFSKYLVLLFTTIAPNLCESFYPTSCLLRVRLSQHNSIRFARILTCCSWHYNQAIPARIGHATSHGLEATTHNQYHPTSFRQPSHNARTYFIYNSIPLHACSRVVASLVFPFRKVTQGKRIIKSQFSHISSPPPILC